MKNIQICYNHLLLNWKYHILLSNFILGYLSWVHFDHISLDIDQISILYQKISVKFS